jgi:hypothetical protein
MPWIIFELVAYPLVWTMKRSRRKDEFEEATFEEPSVSPAS